MLPADDSQRQLTVDFVFASVFAFVFVFVFCKVAGTDRSMAGKSGKNYSGRNSTNIPANFLIASFRKDIQEIDHCYFVHLSKGWHWK